LGSGLRVSSTTLTAPSRARTHKPSTTRYCAGSRRCAPIPHFRSRLLRQNRGLQSYCNI
jgi:hypothetical protein